MPRPYALLRASFPHVTSVGGFINTSMPRDIAIGKEGRLYALCTGNAGPIAILNLEDEDLGSFGAPGFGFRLPSYKCNQKNRDWPVQDGALLLKTPDMGNTGLYLRSGHRQDHHVRQVRRIPW